MDKRFLSIRHVDHLSTCAIDKKVFSILGIYKDMFVYNAYGQFVYISIKKISIPYMKKKGFVYMTYCKKHGDDWDGTFFQVLPEE